MLPTLASGSPNWAAVGGDAQIAGERELEPTAEAVAVDGRDRRPLEAARDAGRRGARPRRAGRSPSRRRTPCARALRSAPTQKAFSPLAASTTRAEAGVALGRVERALELLEHLDRHRVQRLGPVERRDADGAVRLPTGSAAPSSRPSSFRSPPPRGRRPGRRRRRAARRSRRFRSRAPRAAPAECSPGRCGGGRSRPAGVADSSTRARDPGQRPELGVDPWCRARRSSATCSSASTPA